MTTATTYPLRLPKSVKEAAERLSKADGTSLNQFVATAVAEKVAVLEAAAFFEVRAARARERAAGGAPSALLAILSRSGGEPPQPGDELPAGHVPLAARSTPAAAKRRGAVASAKARAAAAKRATKAR